MQDESAWLAQMQIHPDDWTLRLVFADWLEERGDPRGELLRLLHLLTRPGVQNRQEQEARLRELVAAGIPFVGPYLTNSIGMRLVLIPPGTFLMGSPADEAYREADEGQHEVTFTRGYYLGRFPVTQEQFAEIMGFNPADCTTSNGGGEDHPVEYVTWYDAVEFCNRLSKREGLQPFCELHRVEHAPDGRITGAEVHRLPAGTSYRLPTEAEWEYACRAGTTTPFHFGDKLSAHEANFDAQYPYGEAVPGPSLGKPSPVGIFLPNAWGAYDMHGNVWEWCEDHDDRGDIGITRGGSWAAGGPACRSATRSRYAKYLGGFDIGFRVVRVLPVRSV